LKRLKFAAQSEAYSAEQKSLLDETIDTDLAALAAQIEQASPPSSPQDKQKPKRQQLPESLPRREIHHEPHSTTCACGCQLKRIGQDVAEKLDYQPGVFTVERHIRGKWVCAKCETLIQGAGARARHRQRAAHGGLAGPGAGVAKTAPFARRRRNDGQDPGTGVMDST
jgi:transposase